MAKKGETNPNAGRKSNQKMKPYLVYDYLLRNSDENHTKNADEIADYLSILGIEAERRSVYKDIDAINEAIWILDNKIGMSEFEEWIADERNKKKFDNYKPIVYDYKGKGYYVKNRQCELNDIRIILECIYSAKSISNSDANHLVKIMKSFLSEKQAKEVQSGVLVTNRIKTMNKYTLENISDIYEAMSTKNKHKPEKISFKYLKSVLGEGQIERRRGETYVVSPYQLVINDGNYYLLAFDDRYQQIRTYRVDRMKDLDFVGEPRDGEDAFKVIDVDNLLQKSFGMFLGEQKRVEIRFRNSLLDTVLERFGDKKPIYRKDGDHHFIMSTLVQPSSQFYGWLCGLGKGASIVGPEAIKNEFVQYLKDIQSMY